MSSPTRWREDGSEATDELRELMRGAEREVPDAAQIEALTASVLAQLPPPPATLGDAAVPTGVGAGGGAKLLVLAMLTVAGASSWWGLRVAMPPANETGAARQGEAVAPASPSVASSAPPASVTAEPPSPTNAAPASAGASEGERGPITSRRAATAVRDNVRELALLHAARVTRRHAPRDALELLRRHEHDFPSSDLREEREALIIELLQYLEPREAAPRLRAFEASYPQSPYRQHLRDAR